MLRRISPSSLLASSSSRLLTSIGTGCVSTLFLSHYTNYQSRRLASTTSSTKPSTSKDHFDHSTNQSSWTDSIVSNVNYIYDTISQTSPSTYFDGVKVQTEEDIKRNAPSWYHPLQRIKYRRYLLDQFDAKNNKNSISSASAGEDDTNKPPVNIAEQIRKLGLDPQSTFSVLLVYVGFWIAFLYLCLSVLYFSFSFYFFGLGLPRDPAAQNHHKDQLYSDEMIGVPNYVADPEKFVKNLQKDITQNNSCVVIHGDRGSGKSSLTRRITNKLAKDHSDKFSYVIYVRVNPSITSSDPVDMIGQYYGIRSRENVLWVLRIMNGFSKIGCLFSSQTKDDKNTSAGGEKKPLFVFDIHSAPTSSSSLLLKAGGNHNTFRSSLSGSGFSGSSSGDSTGAAFGFDLPLFSSSSLHHGNGAHGFDLSNFMDHASAIATDDEFTGGVVVCLNSTLLHTEAPSLVQSDNVRTIEVNELSEPQALRLVSEHTDEYVQSIMPFSKRTPRFLKKKLIKSINDVKKNDYDGDDSVMIPPISHAKKILAEEYKLMESAASSVFENCRDSKTLRKLASSKDELLWSDVEKYCGNKFGSNEHFRQIAELREGLFVSTGASTYKPRYDVIRQKILPGKKFMEK